MVEAARGIVEVALHTSTEPFLFFLNYPLAVSRKLAQHRAVYT